MRGEKLFFIFFTLFLILSVFAQSDSANSSLEIHSDSETPVESEIETESETEVEVESDTEIEVETEVETEVEAEAGSSDEIELSAEEIDERLGDGGINSGFLHRLDLMLDGWLKSDLENRKERAAEIRTLIRDGKIEEAKKLLELYQEHAEKVEEEVSPEEKEEAEESSEAIDEAFEDLEEDLSDEDKKTFKEIREREQRIKKAARIAEKIASLCNELALLDAEQFDTLCNVDNEKAPEWKKKLHKKLSDEQIKEAKEFAKIMKSCFGTSGRDCECDAIAFAPMRATCNAVKPLAVACSDGDQDACRNMQNIKMPEMPDHLKAVMEEVEDGFNEDSYSQFSPPECEEKGLAGKECMVYVFELHAPEECKEALKDGKIDVSNMREAREACEELMFEKNAPPECIEQGITNPKECAKFFKSQMGNEGPGRRLNAEQCKGLQDPSEKAECFEKLYDEFNNHRGDYERDYSEYYKRDHEKKWKETMDKQEDCARSCAQENKAWSFFNGQCECRDGSGDYQKYYQQNQNEGPRYDPNRDNEQRYDEQRDRETYQQEFAMKCEQSGGRWSCEGRECRCEPGERPPYDPSQQPSYDPSQQPPQQSSPEISESPSGESSGSSTDSSSSGSTDSSTQSETTQVSLTGNIILENKFLRYYFS